MTSSNVENFGDAAFAVDQLQQAARPVIEAGQRRAAILFDQSGGIIDSVSTSIGRDTFVDIGRSMIAYAKQNPLAALLLAASAGAVLISAAKSVRSQR